MESLESPTYDGCEGWSDSRSPSTKKKKNKKKQKENKKKSQIQKGTNCDTPDSIASSNRGARAKCAPIFECITRFITMPFRKARRPPHKRRPLPHNVKAKDKGESG